MSPPPRLLLVTESLGGGLGAAIRSEVAHFEAAGWAVEIAGPAAICEEGPDLDHLVRPVGIPDTIRDARGAWRSARELKTVLRSIRPDIVHCHGIRSFLVTRVLAGRAASVTWHGSRGLPDEPPIARVLRAPVYWLTAAIAQEAIAAGPDIGRSWTFLPHASPLLRSLEQEPPALDGGPPRFAFVGRLAGQKRVEMFVEAVAIAAERTPMTGIVVGAGPREDEIRALATRLGSPVELLGQRDDVGELVASSQALVLTTWFEAVAFAAQEAMWIGRPVVASPVPALRWLVGDAGRFVDDVRSLAAALVELSDPAVAGRLGEMAAKRVRQLVPLDSPWPEIQRRFQARLER